MAISDVREYMHLTEEQVDAIASMSFLSRFNAISKGVIALQDLLFFVALAAVWLAATAVVIEMKQAD